jgi:hypothetical protein
LKTDKSCTVVLGKEGHSLPEMLAVHQQASTSLKSFSAEINERPQLDVVNSTSDRVGLRRRAIRFGPRKRSNFAVG